MVETTDEEEESNWEKLGEEANLVIRTWKRRQKQALTYISMKAAEEERIRASLEAKEQEKEKEQSESLKAQAEAHQIALNKALEEKERQMKKEKEDALKELSDRKEKEKQEALKAKEKEIRAALEEEQKRTAEPRIVENIPLHFSEPSKVSWDGHTLTHTGSSSYQTAVVDIEYKTV